MSNSFGTCGQPPGCGCPQTGDPALQFIANYTVPGLPGFGGYDITDSLGSFPGGHYVLIYCNLGAVYNPSSQKYAIGLAPAGTQLSLQYNNGANEAPIQATEFNTYAEVLAQCYKVQILHAGGTMGIRRLGGRNPANNPGGVNTTFALYKVNPVLAIECPATMSVTGSGKVEVHFRITNPHPSLDYTLNLTGICNGETQQTTSSPILQHTGNPQDLSTHFVAYFSTNNIPQGATLRLIVEEPYGTAPLYDNTYTMRTILSAGGYFFSRNFDPGDGIPRNWYGLELRSSGYLDAIFNPATDWVRVTITNGSQPRISDVWPGVQLGPISSGTTAPYVTSTGPCSGFTFRDVIHQYLFVGFIKFPGTSNVTIRFSSNGTIYNVTWAIT